MLTCKACAKTKAPDEFYASNKARCKACVKLAVNTHRRENIERIRAYDRQRGSEPRRVAARAAYQRTDAYRASHAKACARYEAAHPDRYKARIAVNNAVRDGRLLPWPVCAVPGCGETPEAHHPDYDQPLSVVWLCSGHHSQLHTEHAEMLRATNDTGSGEPGVDLSATESNT